MPTYRNTYSTNYIPNLIDTNNNIVNLAPGDTIESYKLYDNPNLQKILDTPYFKLTKINQVVTSPGSFTNLLNINIIRLTANDDSIVVTANFADNPYNLNLIANTPIDIENNENINTLYFTGVGTIKIEGF